MSDVAVTTTTSRTAGAIVATDFNKISGHNAASAAKPASEHESRLQLLNIAQELQDSVYEHVFCADEVIEQEDIDADNPGPALLSALRSNARQDIFGRAEEIYYNMTTFRVKQELLVPWLSKHKHISNYISNLHIAPQKYPEEMGGRRWVYRNPMRIPAQVLTTALGKTYFTSRYLLDAGAAAKLERQTIPDLYDALVKAGISIRQGVIKVPILLSTSGDFEVDDSQPAALWTAKPREDVNKLWQSMMDVMTAAAKEAKAKKEDDTKSQDVGESGEVAVQENQDEDESREMVAQEKTTDE